MNNLKIEKEAVLIVSKILWSTFILFSVYDVCCINLHLIVYQKVKEIREGSTDVQMYCAI